MEGQNTARDTQPVSCADIEAAIQSNSQRRYKIDSINLKPKITMDETLKQVKWLPPNWSYAKSVATPLMIAMMATDPLYDVSAPNTRRSMEKEAATELAESFDALYVKYDGRKRGWIKSHMNTELNNWAAGATDAPFDWVALQDRKVHSALIDIVCIKYNVRIAVWWSEFKKLTVWPLKECEDSGSAPILNIEVLSSGEAHIMLNPDGQVNVKPVVWTPLFVTIGEWHWIPPCTSPGLSTKTLSEMKSEYAEIAGEAMVNTLPKKIDKATLASVIYRYQWLNDRLVQKEHEIF